MQQIADPAIEPWQVYLSQSGARVEDWWTENHSTHFLLLEFSDTLKFIATFYCAVDVHVDEELAKSPTLIGK